MYPESNIHYSDGPLTGKICRRFGVRYQIEKIIHLNTICSICKNKECQYYGVKPLNRSWLYTTTILMHCQLTEKPTFGEPVPNKGKYEHLIPEESRRWSRIGRADNKLAIKFCKKLRQLIRPFKALQGSWRQSIGIYAHFPIAEVQIGEWKDKLIVVFVRWWLRDKQDKDWWLHHKQIKDIEIKKCYFIKNHASLPKAAEESYPVACQSLDEIVKLVASDIRSLNSDPSYIIQPAHNI
jgi:hypothetical protein